MDLQKLSTKTVRWALFLALAACTAPAYCQAPLEIAPEHNAWARYRRGAWRKVRIVSETFEADGNLTGSSETTRTTTLVRANRNTVVLREEPFLNVAGRRVLGERRNVERDFFNQLASDEAKVEDGGQATISVGGREIDCRVFVLTSSDRIANRTDEVFYSDDESPYVMKRVSLVVDRESDATLSTTMNQVTELDEPLRVIGVTVSTSRQQTIIWDHKGATKTEIVYSMDVPGGVVSETTEEFNEKDELIRRSTLELVGFGGKVRLFQRR